MARDVNDVVVLGFGSWSDVNALPTLGFGAPVSLGVGVYTRLIGDQAHYAQLIGDQSRYTQLVPDSE